MRIQFAERVYEVGKEYPIAYVDNSTGLIATPDDFSIGVWYNFGDFEERPDYRLSVPEFQIDFVGFRLHDLPTNWVISA